MVDRTAKGRSILHIPGSRILKKHEIEVKSWGDGGSSDISGGSGRTIHMDCVQPQR